MSTVGYSTLEVIPSVRGLRAQLEKQTSADLLAAGRVGGTRYGQAAGATAAQGFQSKFRSGIDSIGGKLFAGLGLAAAGKAVVGIQADFESSINTLGVAADLTASEMQRMSSFAKQMGADTVFSASEAADAMVELAKAGLEPSVIEAGALASTMAVAATEGLGLADSARIVSNAMTTFGLEGERAAEVADALAGGSKASTASVQSLSEAMSQVGGSAVDAGLSLQETVAALAAFDQEGIKGSDAGTSLKTMLSRLVPQTEKASNAMADLGLSFTDANGQFLPLADIAGQLQTALSGLSDAERTTALNTIFGSDARRAAIALMHQGKEGIEAFTQATSEAGTAAELADARMSGTAGAIERMKGSIEGAALAIGETLAPGVVVAADGIGTLADAFSKLPGPVQATALAFGALKLAQAVGVGDAIAGGAGKASSAMDTLRLRTMFVADAYDQARFKSVQFADTSARVSTGVGRMSASMSAARVAATQMRLSMTGFVGFLGGGWGIALTAATGLLTLWWHEHQKAKQAVAESDARVKGFTATLDANTGAITENTRTFAAQELLGADTLRKFEELGFGVGTVTTAVLEGGAALQGLQDSLLRAGEASLNANSRFADVIPTELRAHIATLDLAAALNDAGDEAQRGKSEFELFDRAVDGSGNASKSAAQTMETYRSKISDTRRELEGLIEAEEKRALNAIQRRRDQIALIETQKAAEQEARKGAKTLDIQTKAGAANMTALLDLAAQWSNSKNSVQNAQGAYEEMRQQFIAVATEMGATQRRAKSLADELLKVPKTAPLRFQSEGYQERMAEIRSLREAAQNLEVTLQFRRARLDEQTGGAPVFASGGLIGGIGSGTSDSNLIWASRGEFMQRKAAVDYYGLEFMRKLNSLQIPKEKGYARGGLITESRSVAPSGLTIGQMTVVAQDWRDFARKAQRKASAAMSDGVRWEQ